MNERSAWERISRGLELLFLRIDRFAVGKFILPNVLDYYDNRALDAQLSNWVYDNLEKLRRPRKQSISIDKILLIGGTI